MCKPRASPLRNTKVRTLSNSNLPSSRSQTGTIREARLLRFSFPRDRVIGDSQVRIEKANIGVLELTTSDGLVGTGFFFDLFYGLPSERELTRIFEDQAMLGLKGEIPAVLINRILRPRGGNRRMLPYGFAEAIDQALWDLHAQSVGLPLWRLLGGKEGRVRAYASGLDYHLSDNHYSHFFAQAKAKGYEAFKIKVGHRDVSWDLNRLTLLRDAVGPEALIMVDSNEAWTPKEAIRRINAYQDAGFPIYWLEDPCLREDFEGLRQVGEALPHTHLNTGEYLDLAGKRALIAARAVDILNVHGKISDSLRAGWLAAEHGLEVSLGNTSMEIGVHVACALPECHWLEYSFQNTTILIEETVRIEGGYAYAPDRPGHGIRLSDRARAEFRCPEAGQETAARILPAPPIPLEMSAA
jgi:L-alanine-DL-glutamate epimerase-like enolase superfamily enzyme